MNKKNKIKEAFNVVDIVILRGHAGVGKTRLALEFSKEYSKANGYKLYCLKNRSLSIYDDLMRYLNNPDKYFILLDDANQFTNIKNIVEYIMECPNGLSIKLLLTVRDYAFKSLVNEIKSVNDKVLDIPIGEFSDSEIVKLLYELFDIRNSRYQKKIVQLSHGNARLAILAGKIVIETNSLSSISDVSNLYDNYYGIFLPCQENSVNGLNL